MGNLQQVLPSLDALHHVTAKDTAQLIDQVEEGLAFESLEILAKLTRQSVFELGNILSIPERTLARRKIAGKTDARGVGSAGPCGLHLRKAVALFEWDAAPAVQWLTTPKAALAGQTPLRYCRTELGAREVENLIGRLEHGVFS